MFWLDCFAPPLLACCARGNCEFPYISVIRIAKCKLLYSVYLTSTGVDKGGGAGGPAPQWPGKIFFVNIEGLLESVVLNLSFRVRSNAMFTSERRY